MKTIAFFNNKGGVGKTSLVYHLSWMYAELGLQVVAADLDPQANLTSMFLSDERLEALWPDDGHTETVFGAIRPLLDGTGDVRVPRVEEIGPALGLLAGDLALSSAEGELNAQWPRAVDRDARAFRVLSAFWRAMREAAAQREADLVLVDVGPNLGAINRAALLAAHYVVVPLAPDLYSLQGLRNLGPTLRTWRGEWVERKSKNPVPRLSIPAGEMTPAGYVVMQHAVRLDRPVKAYAKWIRRIPDVYREAVLGEVPSKGVTVENDPHCLASLKHYRSLMPLAQEARKPMFFLTPADGAIGGHSTAVQDCYADMRALARRIAERCGLALA
jgi:cellulose biosynthesis protein BcsQ